MEGASFKCKCGTSISRKRDVAKHEKTQKHLLTIQQKKDIESLAKQNNCVHHWKIDSSTGPYSNGYCACCGLQRQFANSVEADGSWRQHIISSRNKEGSYYKYT